jgi:hypothetical protein
MKIYLGKPRYHWINPQRFLDYIFFWTDWSKYSRDPYNKRWDPMRGVDTPKWVDDVSDRLMFISKGIQWVLDKIHPEVNYVKIDKWDTWSMDHTLSPIILPMLKQLKATKHGYGFIDDEDVPKHLQSIYALPKDPWEWDGNAEARYEWVMDEMIWAFEQLCDEDNEAQFWIVHPEMDWDDMKRPFEEGETTREVKWIREGKLDREGLKAHQDRIQRGLVLFGKYFRTLWD